MTRVRMNERCPWPERVGCEGVIVERPAGPEGRVYPWPGRGRVEVIVLLDDDPLAGTHDDFFGEPHDDTWTCALNLKCVVFL